MGRKRQLELGDRVAYSAAFCRSVGAYAGDIPHARGVIVAFTPLGERRLAKVNWDDGDTMNVLEANLAKIGGGGFAAC